MAGTLFTIGYEKAGFPAFVATLQASAVAHVLDVRDLPLSRRAGFSKRALAAGLAAAGIRYSHLRALGTPPAGREANRKRNWPLFWAIVAQRLATEEAEFDLVRAAEMALAGPCCLLCYEADVCTCHRLRVAELLVERTGLGVRHLVVVGGDGIEPPTLSV